MRKVALLVLGLLLLSLPCFAQNQKISDLSNGSPGQATDLIPIARAGANYYLPFNAFPQFTGGAITNPLLIPYGDATAPGIAFTSDLDNGLYGANQSLTINTGIGFPRARLSLQGNGTTGSSFFTYEADADWSGWLVFPATHEFVITAQNVQRYRFGPTGWSATTPLTIGNSAATDTIQILPAGTAGPSTPGILTNANLTGGTAKTWTLPNMSGNILVTGSNVIQTDGSFQLTATQDGATTSFWQTNNMIEMQNYVDNDGRDDYTFRMSNEPFKAKDPTPGEDRYASIRVDGGLGAGEPRAGLYVWDNDNNTAQSEFWVYEDRMVFGGPSDQPIVVTPRRRLPSGWGYFEGEFEAAALTANRTWTLPNASGTFALVETLPPPSGTYSDAFIKNLGGDGFRFPLDVDDYALTNTVNDYGLDGSYAYNLVVSITDTTPSIVSGSVRICGKDVPNNGQRAPTTCENVSCAGAVAAPVTTTAAWSHITHVESSCSVLGGGGDETITVAWTSYEIGQYVVASTNVVAPATAFNASVDFGLTNLAMLSCDDADGCTLTKPADPNEETDIGRELTLITESANAVLVKDSDGDIELAGDADSTLGQFGSLTLMWIGDRWVQTAASNN